MPLESGRSAPVDPTARAGFTVNLKHGNGKWDRVRTSRRVAPVNLLASVSVCNFYFIIHIYASSNRRAGEKSKSNRFPRSQRWRCGQSGKAQTACSTPNCHVHHVHRSTELNLNFDPTFDFASSVPQPGFFLRSSHKYDELEIIPKRRR